MPETLQAPDTLTQPLFYETNKLAEVRVSFEEMDAIVKENSDLPPSPYIQVILTDASIYDRHTETVDAFGPYTEISKGVSLQFAEGHTRFHEELYAACAKDPAELITMTIGGGQLNFAIRGEDAPYPSRPSIELLFTNTADQMEENRGAISEITRQVSEEFMKRYDWKSLEIGSDVNVYFREDETDAWDVFDL